MTDDPDLYERVALGHAAQEVLRNETIGLAIDNLIALYENAWRQTEFDDVDSRELAYRRRGALVDVRAELKRMVDEGEMAAHALKQAEQDATGKGPNV